MHARRIAVMATTLAVGGWSDRGHAAGPASAAVGYRPVPNDSWGTNGTSEEVLIQGGTVYVARRLQRRLHGGSSATRNNVAAFDEASGALVQTFVADTNGTVETLATFGGAVLLGGTFTTVNGVARKNLAKVDLSTGAVDPAFDPSPNNTVYDLWVSGTTLYLGGDFTTMAGQSRPRLAAINLMTTGSLVAGFAPKVDRRVSAVATSPDGATVYVGGRFSTVNPAGRLPGRDQGHDGACSTSTSSASSRSTRPRRPRTSSIWTHLRRRCSSPSAASTSTSSAGWNVSSGERTSGGTAPTRTTTSTATSRGWSSRDRRSTSSSTAATTGTRRCG